MVRAGLSLLLVCAAALVSAAEVGVYIDRRPMPDELKRNDTRAKFEPPYGCYLGAYIDSDRTLKRTFADQSGRVHRYPEEFEAAAGKAHASYFFYMGYGGKLSCEWVRQLGTQGRIVHIALEPNRGLGEVKEDRYLRNLADDLRMTGAPVFLRFASEMNGDWVPYSGNPTEYRQKFRLVSKVMHERAPNVAMVWCPYATPASTIPVYYPGDDAVDWIGVNMYNVTYFNQNVNTPGWRVFPTDMLDFVYRAYSSRKPIMIGEYGVTHYSALERTPQTDYAVRCIKALYMALPRKYPRVKAIHYFDGNNLDLPQVMNNNYAVTQNASVLGTYKAVTAQSYFLRQIASPSALGYRPPLSPMPVREGEVLAGMVHLSAFARCEDGMPRIKFSINGKVLNIGDAAGDWQCLANVSNQPVGPATLRVEAWTGGKLLCARSVKVRIARIAS
ncbi:MAG: copper amine oxidase [Armatimonadetes bacterium]|nr:copper amine oxidase [Armatimonadota bacterium]